MPGREKEHAAYQAQLAEQSGQVAGADDQWFAPLVRPPISEERRNRSPGMQHNFYEVALSDFKRSYGTPVGQPPPPPLPAPASATADDGLQPRRSAGASPQPATTTEGGQPADETEWTRGRGVASADEAELTARVAQLERSNERLQVALSGVREREEAARLLAEEMAAKEAAISLRLKTLEIALSGVSLTENIINGAAPNPSALDAADPAAAAAVGGLSGSQPVPGASPNATAAAKASAPPTPTPPAATPPTPTPPKPPASAPAAPKAAGPKAVGLAPKKNGPVAAASNKKSAPQQPQSVGTAGGTGAISSLSPINPPKESAGSPPISRPRLSMPVKVARIREKLGLAPNDGSLVAAVNEATEKAEVPNEGGPLAAQVDRLMAKLFGDGEGEA